MGQAKQRGTREDRIVQSQERRKEAARNRLAAIDRNAVRLAQLAVAMHAAHGKELHLADALEAAKIQRADVVAGLKQEAAGLAGVTVFEGAIAPPADLP